MNERRYDVERTITRKQLVSEPIPGFTARLVLNTAVRDLQDKVAQSMEAPVAETLMDSAVRDLQDKVAQSMEALVAETLMDYVRIRASKNARIDIRKPRWMPTSLHRWLMRQIVVVETDTTVSSETIP